MYYLTPAGLLDAEGRERRTADQFRGMLSFGCIIYLSKHKKLPVRHPAEIWLLFRPNSMSPWYDKQRERPGSRWKHNVRAVSVETDVRGLQPGLETTLVMTDVLTDCVKMPSLGSLRPMNNGANNAM